MAKIPSFQQGQRLAPGVNQDIVNPGEQRLMGNAVAQLGGAVSQFGGQLDQYYQAKAKIDQALYKAEIGEIAGNKAIEAETFARTNPNAAKDGSSVQSDFSSVFEPLREQIKQEPDRNKRALGYEALNKAELKHRNKLMTFQVEKHNANILDSANNILNSMTTTVQNDPSTLPEKLLELDQLAEQTPFEGKNKESFGRAGRRNLVTAAIEAYAYKGQYDTAKQILNETKAGNFFSQEEKMAMTKDLDTRFRQTNTDFWNEETRNYTRMKRERAENSEKTFANALNEMLNNPANEKQILEDAQQALADRRITPQAFKAIKREQEGINKENSLSLKGNYVLNYLKGQSFDQSKQDIINDMGAGRLTHQDGISALSIISQQAKKEALDPQYKDQKALAKNYIKSAVTPSGLSSLGAFFMAGEKRLLTEITEQSIKLEAEGKNPMEAAREATARVLGVQELRESSDPHVNSINDDVAALDAYAQSIIKRLEETKNSMSMSRPVEEKKVAQILREIKIRKEHIKQKKILDGILKMEKPTK